MVLPWFVAGAALLLAVLAWGQARRTAKRLAQLSEMFWELKYQHGELRTRVQRLAGSGAASPPVSDGQPTDAFVPLSSLRR